MKPCHSELINTRDTQCPGDSLYLLEPALGLLIKPRDLFELAAKPFFCVVVQPGFPQIQRY